MLCRSAEVLTLRLNIPHSESFCAWPECSVRCLVNLEFSSLALCECQALFLLVLLDGYVSSLRKFLHTHLLTSTLLKTGVRSSVNPQDPLSLQLSTLFYSLLYTVLVDALSSHSLFHLLNSGHLCKSSSMYATF